MALPKWTPERTAALKDAVGNQSPVTQATVAQAAEQLETTNRSIASKLRKEGYDVEKVGDSASAKAFTDEQAEALRTFVEGNSGEYTYGQIAEYFADGKFSAKSIQGKILSMELTQNVKPTPKPETVKTYTDAEEATFLEMANNGAFVEEIAEALGKGVNSVRGKALSFLRGGQIESVPKQRDRKTSEKTDPLAEVDVGNMTVAEIAEAIDKSERGVKTMLTRRGINASDYKGAEKARKAAASE